jgi:hypothetical protein
MLAPNGYSQKVVAGELANDAREARAAVGDVRCDLLFQARRRLKRTGCDALSVTQAPRKRRARA